MGAGEEKVMFSGEHWRLKLGGPEADGLFMQAMLPSLTLTDLSVHHVGDKSTPQQTTIPVAPSWSPFTLVRGIDKKGSLYGWIKTALHEDGGGGGKVEKKEVTIELCDAEDAPVVTWTLVGAWPSNYQGPGMDANSASHATETVTFTFDSANIKYAEGG